jgi:aminoglycoside phosphotransferase
VTEDVAVIYELSAEARGIFSHQLDLSEGLHAVLSHSQTIFDCLGITAVFRVSETIAVKITKEDIAMNEHRSLSLLQRSLPDFPAPRPHGLIRSGKLYCLFMSFIPGVDLEHAWPTLSSNQKESISKQLDRLFIDLRSLPISDDTPYGGFGGICDDSRRFTRTNTTRTNTTTLDEFLSTDKRSTSTPYTITPINTAIEFDDFLFAGMRSASPTYKNFLRELSSGLTSQRVFTHGDLRPANIMVAADQHQDWHVASVIDWGSSGVYPDYWESVKMTNNLSSIDNSDWYLYLPESISPRRFRIQWLVDRVRDGSMENS